MPDSDLAPTPAAPSPPARLAPRREPALLRALVRRPFREHRRGERLLARELPRLRDETQCFTDCFYDTTLPPEVVEAVAANLTILKSPTVLRQTDGRLWAGRAAATRGCCHGSCTHVWNYAQAMPHLFPELERTLRQTEFDAEPGRTGPPDLPRVPADPARPTTTSTPPPTASWAAS